MSPTPALGISWLIMLLAGGAGALPSAGAPLPLDPVLSAVAPEDCLWYAATAGSGAADANSANQTEQLFAEPQVQRFLAEIETQIMAAVHRAGGPGPEQRVLATEAPKLVKALLTRPLALYVQEVQPGADNSVTAEAAFIVSTGDQHEAVAGALKELLALAARGPVKITAESLAGVDWQRVETPPQAPRVRFGWKDDYFIIAVGEATPAQIIERMAGSAPAWLIALRAEHPIEREMTIGYLNVAGILERVKPLVQVANPPVWPIVERLGLTSIKALHAVAGYDAEGCTSMAHIVTDGERAGLLAFLPHEPLTKDDLALIPKDALLAGAVRLNLAEALEQGVALASQFDPRAKEEFERGLWEAESHLGVNIREDIVASLGGAWVAYLPSGDLMLSWLNAAAAVQVKDAGKLQTAVSKLIDVARTEMIRSGGRASISESKVDGQTVYSLQFQGEPVPFSPSLCVSDKWLVIGLLPQAVQAALERQPEDSLAAQPPTGVESEDQALPAALWYQDTPQLVRSAYPFVQIGMQMVSSQLRNAGITVDTTALPSVETVVKHLRPTIATWSHQKDGFHVTRRGSLPGGGNAVGSAPVVAALLLPAMNKARGAAREVQEMNNLKQVGLAFQMYETTYHAFPTDVYSEDGKPLLSWRVKLLPFLEGAELYSDIKLDEPWDSEHNKQFHDRMPQVFAAASSPELTNRTRIVALKGSETLFPGNQKLDFKNVTDGTSNTVLFVEAGPESAVEWMKPADIDFNAATPMAGLMQPSGQFIAAFCDGSVRRLSLGISAETMKALATRAGGETTDYDALDVPPVPHLYEVGPGQPVGAQ